MSTGVIVVPCAAVDVNAPLVIIRGGIRIRFPAPLDTSADYPSHPLALSGVETTRER